MSAQLTSSLSRRKTPELPWYVPWASTTSSPSRNVGPSGWLFIMFVYPLCFQHLFRNYGRNFGLFTSLAFSNLVFGRGLQPLHDPNQAEGRSVRRTDQVEAVLRI